MQKIFLVGVLAVALTGCTTASSENGKNTVTAVGSGCAVNVLSETTYQVACTAIDPAKVVDALKMINTEPKK